MNKVILDYFAEVRGSHLHANGESSTEKLIELIEGKAGEKILEIGFGTGATIVQMSSKFKQTHFYGVDTSEKMYRTASGKVRFSLLDSRIELQQLDGRELPFKTGSIDKIFIESVLAIQSKKQLKSLLSEFSRVLKHGGTLLFNETIWLDSTAKNTIKEINSACLETFGIIQSSGDFPYLDDWLKLLKSHGFAIEASFRLSDVHASKERMTLSKNALLSKVYSSIGWLKSKINPRLRREWKAYQISMNSILNQQKPLMSGAIVLAINKN